MVSQLSNPSFNSEVSDLWFQQKGHVSDPYFVINNLATDTGMNFNDLYLLQKSKA